MEAIMNWYYDYETILDEEVIEELEYEREEYLDKFIKNVEKTHKNY